MSHPRPYPPELQAFGEAQAFASPWGFDSASISARLSAIEERLARIEELLTPPSPLQLTSTELAAAERMLEPSFPDNRQGRRARARWMTRQGGAA